MSLPDPGVSTGAAAAHARDLADPLASFKERFFHPRIDGKDTLYFVGNSLGLQPKAVREHLQVELDDWAQLGVEGHFHGTNPWFSYHERLTPPSARLVGARESEVVCMNTLTTNLHLQFVSFYRPTRARYKIISEGKMFPSDRYMLETQVAHHGFNPDDAIIEVAPREGEFLLREDDVLAAIQEHGDELALLFMGGVNYFTGQFFDLAKLTDAAHAVGAYAGFDLAHAVGNVPLRLHDWDVDFAAWCTYKYLNGGAGNVGGLFVHDRHGNNTAMPRFGGWWGHDKDRRFLMENHFSPMTGAEGWQLSNAPVLGMAALMASLEIFEDAGMAALRSKSLELTAYLERVVSEVVADFPEFELQIITPTDADRRGCQLSLRLGGADKAFFQAMNDAGVLCDFREPDVVRLAPVPLYNSFSEVHDCGVILRRLLQERTPVTGTQDNNEAVGAA